jgi:hypothetical protein
MCQLRPALSSARMALAGDPVHALRPHRNAAVFPRWPLEQGEIEFAAFELALEVGTFIGAHVEPQAGCERENAASNFARR